MVAALCQQHAVAVALIILRRRRLRRRRSQNLRRWAHEWILRRKRLGAYANLLKELELEDLLQQVGPLLWKQDTRLRAAISLVAVASRPDFSCQCAARI